MLFKQVETVQDVFTSFDKIYEDCLMEQTIEFNFKYLELKRKMVRLEAHCIQTNNKVLLENGLEEFFKGIIRLLQNLWDTVKDMYKKFTYRLNAQVNMNTQLMRKYDQKVFMTNLNGFSTTGFVYTIDRKIDLNSGVNEIKKIPQEFTESEYLKLSEERGKICDKVRGDIIDGKTLVNQNDYTVRLFTYFRNDCQSPQKISIDKNKHSEFKAALIHSIKDINYQRKKANEMAYKVDEFYSSAINYFKTLSASGNSDEERKYYMEKMELSKEIANIYNEAFSELLRAINENYAQSKRIIVEILNHNSNDVVTTEMVFKTSSSFNEKEVNYDNLRKL